MDYFLRLFKRFGDFLNFKISDLVRPLDSQSIGAIAGLALAIVFTWKYVKTPGKLRGQPKRPSATATNPGTSNPASASSASLENSDIHEDLRPQSAVDGLLQPTKPTLSQMVRKRLSDGRKVTCRLLGVILEECTSEELQKKATVRASVLEVLLEITKFCDLYLMERVLDDESERTVLAALEDAGFFSSGGIVKDKVLFCSTETGRTSFVRQLEPDWHIDSNPEIITQLSRFINHQVYVSSSHLGRPAPNVLLATSLEDFFGSD